jgi:lipoprotein-anchoring transpeptidase ErfK/SrfK
MNVNSAALATLLLALAAPLSSAAAQSYPPGGYRWGPPPTALPDDDEDDPVIYTRRPPRGYPERDYRDAPADPRYGHALPEPTAPGRPDLAERELPPRGAYVPPAGDPPPVIYGSRPGERVYGRPIDPPQGIPSGDPNAPRPPAEVFTGSTQAPAVARAVPGQVAPGQPPSSVMMLPEEDQPEQGTPKELPAHLKRQVVDYRAKDPAGTIVVDTANTYLYFVMGGGKAMRYGIGVGRDGFTWTGREKISRKTEWPDWHPPEQMIERQPYLPRFMAGGPGNPMGARALYLGKTLYRIHGTNQPSTIGQFVSSGCIRLLNDDIEDLFERAKVGTQVVVLPGKPPVTAGVRPPATPAVGLAPAPAREADAGAQPTMIIPR